MVYLDHCLSRSYSNGGVCVLSGSLYHLLRQISGGDLLSTIDASKNWGAVCNFAPSLTASVWVGEMSKYSHTPISFNVYQYTPDKEPLNRVYLDLDLALVYGSSQAGWPNVPLSFYLNKYLRSDPNEVRILKARQVLSRFPPFIRAHVGFDIPHIGAQVFEGFDTRVTSIPEKYRDNYFGKVLGGSTGQIFAGLCSVFFGAYVSSGRTPGEWQSKGALIRTAYMNALRLILGLPLRPVFFVLDAVDRSRVWNKGRVHTGIGMHQQETHTITDAEIRMVYKLSYEHPSRIMRRAAILSFIPLRIKPWHHDQYGAMVALPHREFYGTEEDWKMRIRTENRPSYINRETWPAWVTATNNGLNRALADAQACKWPAGIAADLGIPARSSTVVTLGASAEVAVTSPDLPTVERYVGFFNNSLR